MSLLWQAVHSVVLRSQTRNSIDVTLSKLTEDDEAYIAKSAYDAQFIGFTMTDFAVIYNLDHNGIHPRMVVGTIVFSVLLK
jgi:hypothetical protein